MTTTKSRIVGTVLAGLAVAWAVFRVAPAPLPDLPRFVAALGNWRDRNPDPDYDHLRENLLFQWLFEPAASLGVNAYLLQWVIGVTLVVGGLAWLYRRNVSPQWRGTALRLAILSPVAAIMVGFFGSYDPVTVGLALLLLIAWQSDSYPWVIVVGILLGMQHFGQVLPMIVALGLVGAGLHRDELKRYSRLTLWTLAAVTAGKIIALILVWVISGNAGGSRTLGWVQALRDAITTSVNYFPALVLSLFAGAWAVVVAAILLRAGKERALIVGAFVLLGFTAATFTDQTRIFVLMAFPSLAMLTIFVLQRFDGNRIAVRGIEALAWVITPILLWTDSDGVGRVQYLGALDAQIMAWQQVLGWG